MIVYNGWRKPHLALGVDKQALAQAEFIAFSKTRAVWRLPDHRMLLCNQWGEVLAQHSPPNDLPERFMRVFAAPVHWSGRVGRSRVREGKEEER